MGAVCSSSCLLLDTNNSPETEGPLKSTKGAWASGALSEPGRPPSTSAEQEVSASHLRLAILQQPSGRHFTDEQMPKKSQGGCSGSSSRNALGTQLPEAGGRIQQAPSFCAGFLALSSRVAGATDLCLWKRGEVGRAETSFSGSVSGDRKEGRGPHVPQGPQKAHEKMSLFLCKKKNYVFDGFSKVHGNVYSNKHFGGMFPYFWHRNKHIF